MLVIFNVCVAIIKDFASENILSNVAAKSKSLQGSCKKLTAINQGEGINFHDEHLF